MTTTSQIRKWWAPPCDTQRVRLELHGEGVVAVDHRIQAAVEALDACLRKWDYLTRRNDTGAYNCRKITGGSGYSLHAYSIALDINWGSNPYGPTLVTDMPPDMVAAIKAIRTNNGKQVWRWGGDYSGNKDAMHFEIVCAPADLATGINPATLPGAGQEDDMFGDGDREALIETRNNVRKLVEALGGQDADDLNADELAEVFLDKMAERLKA